jgi:hypothetical protein
MEAWLEGVRPGLGAHASLLDSYGISSVDDLALLDSSIIADLKEFLTAKGLPPFHVALICRAVANTRGSEGSGQTEAAPGENSPKVPVVGVPMWDSQRLTPVVGR